MEWLTKPVQWHSSRERTGFDSTQMTEGQKDLIETRFHNWYTADWDYGLTTVYFFCAVIGATALLRWGSLAWYRRSMTLGSKTKTSTFDRFVALASYTTARGWHVKALGYYSPPLAAILGVAAMSVWVIVMMLAVRPWYWPNPAMGFSPPIATRSGWISLGIMPFMIAFATKNNYVALLTRTSHERLQVFHRWSALLMYITSLVHTFPFIVEDINMGMMEMEWRTDRFNWTGVAALVPQTWLLAMSWGFMRNRYYEFFKKFHFIAAGIFMAALFIHVDYTLTSWDYFAATLALYGTVWVFRVVRATLTLGTATVTLLEDRTLRVRIAVPGARFRWTAGQHVFVRFLLGPLHWGTSHPFTIVNLPPAPAPAHDGGERANNSKHVEIEIVMRTRGGITKALERAAAAQAKGEVSLRVFVDGPYGYVGLASDLRRFDRVLLLAGGSGATFTVPLLIDLVRNKAARPADAKIQSVIAVREGGAFTWLEQELKPLSELKDSDVSQHTHVTRQHVADIDPEKGEPTSDELGALHDGRPNVFELVHAVCGEPGRVAVVACGPDEFAHDVRRAVAAEHMAVARKHSAVAEVFLHVENYSW
ncbi:ferric reductase NAD binding domain-containing protein [Mycena capillaripes]|nr:ferric reductase NAD binding domain-containing protein [Mycena capillaripes]